MNVIASNSVNLSTGNTGSGNKDQSGWGSQAARDRKGLATCQVKCLPPSASSDMQSLYACLQGRCLGR